MRTEKRFWLTLGLLISLLVAYMLKPFLSVLVYSLFIYHVARPLNIKLKARMHGTLAPFISLFIVVLPIMLILVYSISVASVELNNALESANPDIKNMILSSITELNEIAEDFTAEDLLRIMEENSGVGRFISTVAGSIVNVLAKLFLAFVLAFYFLKDGRSLRKWIVGSCFNSEAGIADRFLDDMDEKLHAVYTGNILAAAFTAIIAIATFGIINSVSPHPSLHIPYAVLLGILCGIANLIPAVGMKLVWIPLFIYLGVNAYFAGVILTYLWWLILYLIVVNVVVDIIPDNILRPYISGRKLHTGVMLFAYILGPIAFGLSGVLIGPLVVVAASSFIKEVIPRIKRKQ